MDVKEIATAEVQECKRNLLDCNYHRVDCKELIITLFVFLLIFMILFMVFVILYVQQTGINQHKKDKIEYEIMSKKWSR